MMAKPKTVEVPSWKMEAVSELIKLIESYPVIGVLDIADLPAKQFQLMRQKLRGKAEIVVSKNTLVSIAIKEAVKSKGQKFDELEFIVVHRPHLTYLVDPRYQLCFATRKPDFQDLVQFTCTEPLLGAVESTLPQKKNDNRPR